MDTEPTQHTDSAAQAPSTQPLSFTVPEGVKDARADKWLCEQLPGVSRTLLQKTFGNKQVILTPAPEAVPETEPGAQPAVVHTAPHAKDSRPSTPHAIHKNVRIHPGDTLTLPLPTPKPLDLVAAASPAEAPLDILFEDAYILVVNKPAGITVHPGNGTEGTATFVEHVLHYVQSKGETLAAEAGPDRPGVVHRLDKPTSGAMCFAKTAQACQNLQAAFANRTVHKQYVALVCRGPRLDAGDIEEPIRRHPTNRIKMEAHPSGRLSHTTWKVLRRLGTQASLVQCTLHTGRTHQIRVHMAHMGHSLLGDTMYGYRPKQDAPARVRAGKPFSFSPPRVMLHAQHLGFAHPITGEAIACEAPLPPDFEEAIRVLG